MGGGRRASMANSEFSAPPDSGEEMLDPFDEVPVEISFSCEGLPLLEMTGSCMSVFAVVWLYNRTDRRWQEHGRTEVVRHGDDPIEIARDQTHLQMPGATLEYSLSLLCLFAPRPSSSELDRDQRGRNAAGAQLVH